MARALTCLNIKSMSRNISLARGGERDLHSPMIAPLQPEASRDAVVPGLLTVPELAELLRTSVGTVYRLVEHRELTFLKVRGSLRFIRRDVERYLERRKIQARE